MIGMEIRTFPLSDLNPAPYNPRVIDATEKARLTASIQTFGYVDPLIVNVHAGRNVVVGGNQRLAVLQDLEVTEVDAVVVDLSVEEEMALNVALNKISGRWDYTKLSVVFEELMAADFDAELTGFSAIEIDGFTSDPIDIDGFLSENRRDATDDPAPDPGGGPEQRTVVCPHCGGEVAV